MDYIPAVNTCTTKKVDWWRCKVRLQDFKQMGPQTTRMRIAMLNTLSVAGVSNCPRK